MNNEDVKISVAIPVFNGEETISRTIESVLSQTRRDFELCIYNNASTDRTQAIVEAHMQSDQRIRLVTHKKNLGPFGNFRYAALDARKPLFAFVAADDWWEPEFLQRTATTLEQSPNASCATCRATFHAPDGSETFSSDNYTITGTVPERTQTFLRNVHCNTRFYGVHRTDVMKWCFRRRYSFNGHDWYITVLSLVRGEHIEVPVSLIHRTANTSEKYFKALEHGMWPFKRRWPLGPLTLALLLDLDRASRQSCWPELKRLNGLFSDALILRHRESLMHQASK
jgi:glycosyltransferase involved in cell wall biosynthesis